MANRYFRNTGNANWNVTTNWSDTDGGASVGALPTAADAVFVTANSGNLTVNSTGMLGASLDFTGYTGTLAMNTQLTISGNVTLSPAMTITGSFALIINAAATLTSNGKIWPGNLTLSAAATYTLADDWTVNGTFTSGTSAKVLNGGKLTLTQAMTITFSMSGTSEIVLAGTGTWTGAVAQPLKNNLTINTSGTITLAANVSYNTGTLKYTAGTIVNTGSLLTSALATTFDTGTMLWNNVSFTIASTYTLLSDLHIAGNFTSSGGGTKTINGSTLYIGGNFTVTNSINGTTNIIMNGTGIWTVPTSANAVSNNLTFNTAGTITVSGNAGFNTGTLKYIAGTIVTTGSTLYVGAGGILDTNGIIWNTVNFSNTTIPFIITSLLTANTITDGGSAQRVISGTAGFIVTNWIWSTSSVATGWALTPGITYRITTLFQALLGAPTTRMYLKSTVPGTKATVVLDAGATCSLGFINITDIDASGGRKLSTFNGIISNCNNVNAYSYPYNSLSKSFVR